MKKPTEELIEECNKALKCLYLEVDASIADDIAKRVKAAIDAMQAQPIITMDMLSGITELTDKVNAGFAYTDGYAKAIKDVLKKIHEFININQGSEKGKLKYPHDIIHTPDEWCKDFGLIPEKIKPWIFEYQDLNPQPWTTPMTKPEFILRVLHCSRREFKLVEGKNLPSVFEDPYFP